MKSISFVVIINYFCCKYNKIKFYDNNPKVNKWLHIRGFSGLICILLWYQGIDLLNLGDAISIIMITPIFTVILSSFILNEKFTIKRFLCSNI